MLFYADVAEAGEVEADADLAVAGSNTTLTCLVQDLGNPPAQHFQWKR